MILNSPININSQTFIIGLMNALFHTCNRRRLNECRIHYVQGVILKISGIWSVWFQNLFIYHINLELLATYTMKNSKHDTFTDYVPENCVLLCKTLLVRSQIRIKVHSLNTNVLKNVYNIEWRAYSTNIMGDGGMA